mgnify:CR=1 FL=1
MHRIPGELVSSLEAFQFNQKVERHDFAAELADQYLVMERGAIIARGLGRDMETGADPDPRERELLLEARTDPAEDRHLALGPLDAADAFVRKAQVGDVVRGKRGGLAASGVTGVRAVWRGSPS